MCGYFVEQGQRLFGFLDVEARDGKPRMHDDIVADRDIFDERDRYAIVNPADFDLGPLVTEQCCDPHRNGEAHGSGPDRGHH